MKIFLIEVLLSLLRLKDRLQTESVLLQRVIQEIADLSAKEGVLDDGRPDDDVALLELV